jgi:very-short-patch-repair endonuclease
MAAVLACGEGAVLSHRSAAALWELLPARPGAVDVIVDTRSGRRPRRGIRIHRTTTLARASMTRRKGIPVTAPARTIADLRWTAEPALARRALRQAAILGLPLNEVTERGGSRSELEDHFIALCRRHRLPSPEVNVRIGPFLVDFLWRDLRLIVEVDGYRYHRGRLAFEADRSRDVELKLAGYEVIRLTYRQVVNHRERTARRLAALLSRAQGGRGPA